MANSPANDIATMLANDGIATIGTDLFVGREPDKTGQTITVFDTGADQPAEPKWGRDYFTVQVRVRGTPRDYDATWTKADTVKNRLHSRPAETIDGIVYAGVWALGDLIFLTYDESERPIVVGNYRTIREHTTVVGHREPIS